MLGFVLALAVGAPPEALRLAAVPWQTLNVKQAEADFFLESFTQLLADDRVKITTPSEISALLGMERQRQLLGCGNDSQQCMAELASALGADYLVQGTLGRFESRYDVALKIIRARDAQVVARFSGQAGRQDQVNAVLADAADKLRADLLRAVAPSPAETGVSAGTSRRTPWWLVPAIAGVGAVVSGAVLWSASNSRVNALNAFDPSIGDPDAFGGAARTERGSGIALVAVGSALVLAALAWLVFGGGT